MPSSMGDVVFLAFRQGRREEKGGNSVQPLVVSKAAGKLGRRPGPGWNVRIRFQQMACALVRSRRNRGYWFRAAYSLSPRKLSVGRIRFKGVWVENKAANGGQLDIFEKKTRSAWVGSMPTVNAQECHELETGATLANESPNNSAIARYLRQTAAPIPQLTSPAPKDGVATSFTPLSTCPTCSSLNLGGMSLLEAMCISARAQVQRKSSRHRPDSSLRSRHCSRRE